MTKSSTVLHIGTISWYKKAEKYNRLLDEQVWKPMLPPELVRIFGEQKTLTILKGYNLNEIEKESEIKWEKFLD